MHPRDVERLGSLPLDVLVTHDHPAGIDLTTGFPLRPTDQAICEEQRFLLREAVDRTNPQLVLHGHWHHRHSAQLRRDNGPTVVVEGLGCDTDGDDAFLELDLAGLFR